MAYMFLMGDRGYYLEQYWYFDETVKDECAVKFFAEDENNELA
jgi:hypothetical protein